MTRGLPAGVLPGAIRTAACPDCGAVHEYTAGTRAGKLCPDCFRKRNAKRQRDFSHKQRVPLRCRDCATPIPPRTGSGKPPTRCPVCQRKALLTKYTRRYYSKVRTFISEGSCSECGAPFPRTGGGGPVPSMCPVCSEPRERDRLRAKVAVRRARRRMLPAEVISPQGVFERDNWACKLCRLPIDRDLRHPHPDSASVDHVTPLSAGGHHVWANVQAAHLKCNLRKGAKR